MTKFFSQSTLGFYDDKIHAQMPDDVVEITDDKHREIMTSQSDGKVISADQDGNPIAIDREPIPQETLIKMQIKQLEEKITNRRLRDAILTQDGDIWLADVESQIAQLRAQL